MEGAAEQADDGGVIYRSNSAMGDESLEITPLHP
jgi:hypothetical protein